MNIRSVSAKDADALVTIYNHYINETVITFETTAISAVEMLTRINNIQDLRLPYLVAENEQGELVGYAYANLFKERFAYRHSVEVTVYLAPESSGNGIGSQLYQALFAMLKKSDVHVIIAGITLPNAASVALHEKFSMEKVAHFNEVGFKFGQWLDVGYWQRIL